MTASAIIWDPVVRARVVKGWAFMALPEEEVFAVRQFLASGDPADLPDRFVRDDYSIYESRRGR